MKSLSKQMFFFLVYSVVFERKTFERTNSTLYFIISHQSHAKKNETVFALIVGGRFWAAFLASSLSLYAHLSPRELARRLLLPLLNTAGQRLGFVLI